jgi:hypothetical protein
MVSSLASEAEQKEDSRDHGPAVFSREVFVCRSFGALKPGAARN